jgi:hypothetical protein
MLVTATEPAFIDRLNERFGRARLATPSWIRPAVLGGFSFLVLAFHTDGIASLASSLTTTQPDTRILAARWIEENVPPDVLVNMEGNFPEYLPPLFTRSKGQTLNMAPIDRRMLANPLLERGWDHYYDSESARRSPLSVRLLKKHGYQPHHFRVASGGYIVTSSYVYDRYWEEHVIEQLPEHAANVHVIYGKIRAQEHVARFEGRGPRIDIYRVHTAIAPD